MKKRIKNRFGTIAVEKGFINTEELMEALSIQANENVEEGKHRLIGQILLDMGLLTESQIDEVVDALNNTMIYTLAVGR